jgi:FAD/FMN-containing dehydrogenase/Fe-S oxidoreductase
VDAKRRRMRDDWRGHFRGELLLDEISRGLYSTDASLFEIEPLAVACPLDEDDLRFLVRYAYDQHIPIVPRGAGTGVAGESLGSGLVVDLSVHFRNVLEINSDSVRVQPGVVCRNLNAQLAGQGRRFAPDPASSPSCTIGGMLATNASGGNVIIHGYTRDHVQALRIVWDNAEASSIQCPTPRQKAKGKRQKGDDSEAVSVNGAPDVDPRDKVDNVRTIEIERAVTALLEKNKDLIDASRPRTPFNRCGYLLHDVLGPCRLDLPRLLVGSEGTLALFSEATLRTVPLPGGKSAVLFGFDSLESALRGAEHARAMMPSACELLDRRLLTLTRGQSAEMARLIPAGVEAVMLVGFERDSSDDSRQAGLELIDRVQRLHHLALFALPAFDEPAIARLWQIREAALPALYSLGQGPRPLAFVEDIGIPPDEMSEFINRLQTILQRFETTASYLIHAATGQIHARPFLDLGKPADTEKLWAIAEHVHTLAIDMGGTISTQHGTGIARTPWVEKQYGPLFPVFRELKAIFDPNGVLNPGKIVGLDPSRPAWPLRTGVKSEAPVRVEAPVIGAPEASIGSPDAGAGANGPAADSSDAGTSVQHTATSNDSTDSTESRRLLWQADELTCQIAACNGCGACRTENPVQRMCPTFRVSHHEAATPRAKANLLRHLLASPDGQNPLGVNDVRAVADLCINCKMCAHECPAHVNVPKLMLEAKAAHQAQYGLDRSDWILSRIESIAEFGSNFALVSNTLLGNPPFRWLVERVLGLSRQRRLPEFTPRSFLKRARRRGWNRKPRRLSGTDAPKAAYFVDLFPNVFDPLIAEATIAVLRHHGVEALVPLGQKSSGMSALAQGDVELARETVQHNLHVFAELAREGYTIICSEPSAAIMLRQDALALIDDSDARLVAAQCVELTSYLWHMHEEGRLRSDLRPIDLSIGHHVPCHMKALGAGVHGPGLLSLIPQLKVHTIDVSCSGMAGAFGLKSKNYATSLAAGRPMLDELSRPRVQFGSSECGSCRMQMEQGSGKRSLHPVQYLALAYGLLPEIGRKLNTPLKPKVRSQKSEVRSDL